MACPSVVVVGASAGGLEAVVTFIRSLPKDFPAAVFVVIHRGADGPAVLPSLIARDSPLPVRVAADSEPIRPGHVYLPPLDSHLLIEDSRVRASHGPRQHGFRPAVDPLFVSAANAYHECAAGVILSGALDDGTAGLLAIKRLGGLAIVQAPEEALVPSMPLSALKNVEVDAVLPVADIGRRLIGAIEEYSHRRGPTMRRPSKSRNSAIARSSIPEPAGNTQLTPFTCPECGGALWEVEEGTLDQYQCHVGHRFGSEALKALGDDRTENILWSAVRALQETSMLRRRMSARAEKRGMDTMAKRWQNDAEKFGQQSRQIRELIEAMNGGRDDETVARADVRRVRASRKQATRAAKSRGRTKTR